MNGRVKTGGLVLVVIFAALIFSRNGAEIPSNSNRSKPVLIPPNLEQMEAPMLQELVESGLLPPLSERLPKNPVVIVPA